MIHHDTVIRGAVLSFLREVDAGPWPPREVRRLRVLWDEGLSFALIARRMGRNRNQIMGKVYRLKWDREGTKLAVRSKQQCRPKKPPTEKAVALTVTPMVSHGVTLFDLAPRCCRFVIGEDAKGARFCGETKRDASPYCPDHHLRCYIQRKAA